MLNKFATASLLTLAFATLSITANAGIIVDWDLTGTPGNQASSAASSNAAHVSGTNLTRGTGLTASNGSDSINASGWTGESTDYFSFGFTVDSGYQVDLSSMLMGTRSSNTGPGTVGLFYSGDGFTTALHTFDQTPGSNVVHSVIDLSGLPDLTGSTQFRVAQIGTASANGGTTGSSGTFRIAEFFNGTNYTNLQLNGSVSAFIPEPGSHTLMLAGLGLLGFMAHRASKSSGGCKS